MVCMIADYRENGIDRHNEYIATNTDDFEKAVHALADVLGKQGATVSCITVCPNAKSMEDLQQMANEGRSYTDILYFYYIFDVEGIRGQV